jgi:hypothetical protein
MTCYGDPRAGLARGPPDGLLDNIPPHVIRATVAATIVEMEDGRLAILVEMEPDPGLGPLVVDPVGEASALADPDGPAEQG